MSQTTVPPNQSGNAANEALVQSAIQEIRHIATLPEVTLKIIRLVEDANSTAQDLNNVISHDPALGARILKVVNSAFYGLPGQIGSINRAIVLLGMNAVKNIAIAASLAKLFRGGQICEEFNARDLWTHSISVAACTRLLSKEVKLGLPDEAFLAGLIHDLGIMVEMQAKRNEFAEVFATLKANPQMSFREAEMKCIGATHEEFGAALCKSWKFPASFAYVTGYHHHPMDVHEKNRGLPGLVHIADIIAAKNEMGFTQTVETDVFNPKLLESLGLTREQVDSITEELPGAIEEASTLLQDAA